MKVISEKYLPARPPLALSIAIWLLMDRYKAPGWVYGTVGTLMAIDWIVCIVLIFIEHRCAPTEIEPRPNGD